MQLMETVVERGNLRAALETVGATEAAPEWME